MNKPENVQRRFPRWKRKRQMLVVLYYLRSMPLTMRQIAFYLEGVNPSNHLLKILHEMESESMVTSQRIPYRKNADKLYWKIAPIGKVVVDLVGLVRADINEI